MKQEDKEYNERLERFICAAVTAYGSMNAHPHYTGWDIFWIEKMTKKALELYDELELERDDD